MMNQSNSYCPICNDLNFTKYKIIESFIENIPQGLDRSNYVKIELLKCLECNLFKTNYLSKEINLNTVYSEESISFDASVSKFDETESSAITTDELSMIANKGPCSLLEIGCGAGHLLMRATKKGYITKGIDLDKKAINFVTKKLKLNAEISTIEDLPTAEKYDVIILIGVFEHIENPKEFLNAVTKHLNSNGEIIMGLPNVSSLNRWVSELSSHSWDMFLEPGHIYHYRKNNIEKLLINLGFEIRFWKTASIKIRGKIPFLPSRSPSLEKRVQEWIKRSNFFRYFYLLILKIIDFFKLGDIILINFQKK